MATERIAELNRLCEALKNEGNWSSENENVYIDCGEYFRFFSVHTKEQAAFIAAARTALPELLKRETAKAVVLGKGMYYNCPNCNDEIDYCGHSAPISDTDSPTYCRCCGQRLDWDVPGVI
jgi:hypothetical protein